jgi:hypothetical protein
MATSRTKWAKGVSGNPRGRPKKNRALTTLLEQHGNKRVFVDSASKSVRQKDIFVAKVWQGLTTGRMVFDDGADSIRIMWLDAQEYLQLARLVFSQIDGAPPAVDATDEGSNQGHSVVITEVVVRKHYD